MVARRLPCRIELETQATDPAIFSRSLSGRRFRSQTVNSHNASCRHATFYFRPDLGTVQRTLAEAGRSLGPIPGLFPAGAGPPLETIPVRVAAYEEGGNSRRDSMPPDPNTLSGGSLLIAWQLKDKRVLIVGGGDVASGRLESVLVADALITLIAPRDGLHPLTRKLIDTFRDRITYHDRVFAGPDDLRDVDMVLTAIDDVEKSREICALCRASRIPVNVADIPPSCDFYFGSQIRDGPLQIMISTNGHSPKLANLIRKRIEQSVPEHAGDAIEKVGELRTKLRERAPGVGGPVGKRRMRWMIDVCTAWEVDELAVLDDELMARLLDDGWEKDRVPKLSEIGGSKTGHSNRTPIPSVPGLLLPGAVGFLVGALAAASVFLLRKQR